MRNEVGAPSAASFGAVQRTERLLRGVVHVGDGAVALDDHQEVGARVEHPAS